MLAVLGLEAVVSPLGTTVNGSRWWIRLPGGFSLQPSEPMKVALAIGPAMLRAERDERGLRQRRWGWWATWPRRRVHAYAIGERPHDSGHVSMWKE